MSRVHRHSWCSPDEVVGGCQENPGVWSQGGAFVFRQVCRHCGKYRRLVSDAYTDKFSYEPADERSRAWVDAGG
jgi:hypothetical protein